MSHVPGILVSAPWRAGVLVPCLVVALTGCGQKGALFLPTGPEAAERATLPQTVLRPFGRAEAPAPENGTATTPRRP